MCVVQARGVSWLEATRVLSRLAFKGGRAGVHDKVEDRALVAHTPDPCLLRSVRILSPGA